MITTPRNIKYVTDSVYNVNPDDYIINVDTSLSAVTIVLPSIQASQLNLYQKEFYINDISNNSSVNNITIVGANCFVNGGQNAIINTNNGSAFCTIVDINSWQVTLGDTGGASAAKSYGSFYDTTNQSGVAGNVLTMSLNTSDSWNSGVSIVSGTRITVAKAGVYNLAFSAQMVKDAGNNATHAHIWLSQNGNTVPNSASQIGFPSNSVYMVAAWNFFFETTTPNEYVELNWEINSNVNNGLIIKTQAASGNIPVIPSLIVTVNEL